MTEKTTAHTHYMRPADPPQHEGEFQLFQCDCGYEGWRSTAPPSRPINPNAHLAGFVPKGDR